MPSRKPEERPDGTPVGELIKIAGQAALFHTPDREAYAVFDVDGHAEVWAISSEEFGLWLMREYYRANRLSPSRAAVEQTKQQIKAAALFDAPEAEVYVRIAEVNDRVYVDLADREWRAIEVDSYGWRVVDRPPVNFRRSPGMRPLIEPKSGGNLKSLRPFLNLPDEDDWVLFQGFLVSLFRDSGPHAVLVVNGEQGSAKSMLTRIARRLSDPQTVDAQGKLKDERDLMIAANNSWLVAFDNISKLPREMSDALCRLATGSGLRTRELYTNTSEIGITARRPVILNGIPDFVWASDLEDRSISLDLKRIHNTERKTERELSAELDRLLPEIIGAVLDAVSMAIKCRATVKLPSLPRLADMAIWVEAAAPALDAQQGAFVAALERRQSERQKSLLEGDPIARALIALVESKGEIIGTATEIAELLRSFGTAAPRTSRSMATQLRGLAMPLRAQGYIVEQLARTATARQWRIAKVDQRDANDDSQSVASVDQK